MDGASTVEDRNEPDQYCLPCTRRRCIKEPSQESTTRVVRALRVLCGRISGKWPLGPEAHRRTHRESYWFAPRRQMKTSGASGSSEAEYGAIPMKPDQCIIAAPPNMCLCAITACGYPMPSLFSHLSLVLAKLNFSSPNLDFVPLSSSSEHVTQSCLLPRAVSCRLDSLIFCSKSVHSTIHAVEVRRPAY
jgi:hypothetical protein